MTKHRAFRARPLRALAAFAAVLGIVAATSLAAAAPPASAASNMRCNNDNGLSFNACLSFDYLGYGWWDAHVGIDVYMPEYYARAIVACGNSNFKASLRGDDGKGANDPVIRELSVVPGWPRADSTGIAAELIGPNLGDELNEDDDSQDELYARVSFYDCHTGDTRDRTGETRFTTGIIRGNFD
jgi:hypothetical protein